MENNQSQFQRLCDLTELVGKRVHLRVIEPTKIKPLRLSQLSILIMTKNAFKKWVIMSEYEMSSRDAPSLEELAENAIDDLEQRGILHGEHG